MNICYLDFWPGFDVNCNWFNLVFLDIFNGKELNFNSSKEEADIIMFSSFGRERFDIKNNKAVKIFYTGENERAELTVADFSLSFDFDTHNGRNFRLPHWYLYVNWWGVPNFPHARISVEQLLHKYDPEEILNRKNFCSIVIGNPVKNRLEVAYSLNSHVAPVHGYGRVYNNPYSGCKVDLLKNYRYNICFENSVYPGYVTEKLLEAKVAGCVPIYYGDLNSASVDFNEKSFIFYTNTEGLVSNIQHLEKNPKLFTDIVSENLFKTNPDLSNLYSFLKNAIGA